MNMQPSQKDTTLRSECGINMSGAYTFNAKPGRRDEKVI